MSYQMGRKIHDYIFILIHLMFRETKKRFIFINIRNRHLLIFLSDGYLGVGFLFKRSANIRTTVNSQPYQFHLPNNKSYSHV